MPHEVKKYLYDIQRAIEKIESFIKDKTYEELTKIPSYNQVLRENLK